MQALLKGLDARYFQIFFQTIFLSYGLLYLHWTAEWWLYVTYFSTSVTVQFFCELVFNNKNSKVQSIWERCRRGIPSAIISSFGLVLLLKTNHISIAVFAAFISIISKYIIRVNGKHIFNPSALGIVAACFLTNDAWISPAQWGSNVVLMFWVFIVGFIVVTRVQKLEVTIAFLGTFAGLLFIRQIIFLGWPMDFFVQSISTGSLLLFSFFMITDPRTTPNHIIARIVWCVAVAAVSFYVATFKFINGAPIIVLVCSQPLVPLLDKIFKAKKFKWTPLSKPLYAKGELDYLNVKHSINSKVLTVQ